MQYVATLREQLEQLAEERAPEGLPRYCVSLYLPSDTHRCHGITSETTYNFSVYKSQHNHQLILILGNLPLILLIYTLSGRGGSS